MWPRRFFAGRYFAPRYFPVGGEEAVGVAGWVHDGAIAIDPGESRAIGITGSGGSITINPGNTRSI